MDDRHVALEFSGADTQKGNPVAVPGIHVGLDLEDESGKGRMLRRDAAADGRVRSERLLRIALRLRPLFSVVHSADVASPRRGRMLEKTVQEQLHAEVVDPAPEEHGRDPPG